MIRFLILLIALLIGLPCFGKDYGKVSTHKVTETVYLFTTTPYGDVGLSGNSVAVLLNAGVLVFDSNGLPETAATILGEIRKLTSKPVRYLVNSHWHWDHWAGNQVYREAFPDLKIITHEKTRQLMLEVEPKFNEEGLKIHLPNYVKDLEKKLQAARNEKSESKIKELEELYAMDSRFLAQKSSLQKTLPNVTFSDALSLWSGGMQVRILHARGITAGDTYLYIPQEKILVTGDMMLQPYPYAIGGTYPSDWLKALESFAVLQPSVIIPGHGDAIRDTRLLQGQIEMFREVLKAVKEAKQKTLTLDQTKDAMGKEAATYAAKLGITDAQVTTEFKSYFLEVFVARAFKELDQPLPDV